MSGGGPPSAGPSGGYGQHQQHGGGATPGGVGGAAGASAAAATPAPVTQSAQNLNQIVTDYLLKRGFNKTEQVFRVESKHLGPDGKPIDKNSVDDMGAKKYAVAFRLLSKWIEGNLDIYKVELNKLLWPIFVYSYIDLVNSGYNEDAKLFLAEFHSQFERVHGDDLKTLSTVAIPQHVKENNTTKLYQGRQYRVPLTKPVFNLLIHFLEREEKQGGSVILSLMTTRLEINKTDRGVNEPYSFDAIYRREQNQEVDDADLEEGIPGVFTGIRTKVAPDVPLKLGPLPMEPELRDDVRAELEEEDLRNPPNDGKPSLVDDFDQKIKREESADVPTRADLPLPQSRAKDVHIEIQKVRENRDRFRIEGRTGGVGVPVTVCMFTMHNTLGSVSCMDFSKDQQLVAAGTMDSYIRVWSLDGKPLKSKLDGDQDPKVNNRRLIGHSAPVYGVSFSDTVALPNNTIYGEDGKLVEASTKLLLSCSADSQVRLWSLETWSCLCIYKGHEGPVFRVLWSPQGHYFASIGWDKTARIWMQDHASAVRICVGHDTSLSALAWHPNGTYIFSASDESDKSIRMFSVVTGECVRVFTGHTDYISAMECAPNGKILASADNGGNIIFWDLSRGTRIKRSRGHGKGGVTSLSFSVESTVLASGGLDGTVRIWDVELPADGNKALGATSLPVQPPQQDVNISVGGDSIAVGGPADRTITVGGQPPQPSVAPAATTGSGGGSGVGSGTGKKKGKEVMITPDQISAFPTKKTPVRKVHFTRMNLVVAGGCYDPER